MKLRAGQCSDEISDLSQVLCVQSFFPRLMGHCWVEGYATGNFSAAQAAELAACVQSVLVRPLMSLLALCQVGRHHEIFGAMNAVI